MQFETVSVVTFLCMPKHPTQFAEKEFYSSRASSDTTAFGR